jgi:FkbM family methyltransferase
MRKYESLIQTPFNMILGVFKKIVPYGCKLRLREWVLTQYGIPYSRFDISGPLVTYLRGRGPISLIDVGASSGDFSESIIKFCGVRKGLLIEPIPRRCEELRAKFTGGNFEIICGAVGDKEAELEMEVLKWDYASSILPVIRTNSTVTSVLDLSPKEKVKTRVQSLDEILDKCQFPNQVDLLKIDVQGAEHLVLDGARKALQRVQAIYTEISFRALYEGSATFEGISERCRKAGFRLTSLNEGFRGSDGELLQGDALYLRDHAVGC